VVPLQGKRENEKLLLESRDLPKVVCYDPNTGAVKWSEEFGVRDNRSEPLASSLVVDESRKRVYAIASQTLVAIDTDKGAVKWQIDRQQLSEEESKKADKNPSKLYLFSGSVVAQDNTLYVPCSDNRMRAFDTENGRELWSFTCRRAVGVPILQDGLLIFGSVDRYLYALNIKNGALVWRANAGGRVLGQPRIVNGMVYVPTQDGQLFVMRLPIRS